MGRHILLKQRPHIKDDDGITLDTAMSKALYIYLT